MIRGGCGQAERSLFSFFFAPRPWPRSIIPERIISLPHSLAETSLSRPCYEDVALLGVASDAVEERAERAAGREAHVFDGLVAEQFEHDELASGQLGHSAREGHRVLLELFIWHRLKDQAD